MKASFAQLLFGASLFLNRGCQRSKPEDKGPRQDASPIQVDAGSREVLLEIFTDYVQLHFKPLCHPLTRLKPPSLAY